MVRLQSTRRGGHQARAYALGLALTLLPAAVHAQAVTGYELSIYTAGAPRVTGAALATIRIPDASIACGLVGTPPAAATSPVDISRTGPIAYAWTDPTDATKYCLTSNLGPAIRGVTDRLPPGVYDTALQQVQASAVSQAAVPQLRKPATAVCSTPLANRQTVLSMTVNTAFPITVTPNQLTEIRFTFAYTFPVVYAAVLVDGAEVMHAAGDDLHGLSGFWFVAPTSVGNHQVTVYGRDAAGCEYRSGLTRTLTVLAPTKAGF